MVSSIIKPPELELKPLPTHLEFEYLRDKNTLPVVVVANLDTDQEEAILDVLKRQNKAIEWMIVDIKGINLAFCHHKIKLEEGKKLVVDAQRKLNLVMKELKKELLKWLDASIAYAISNSEWVSPCVSEKRGLNCNQ